MIYKNLAIFATIAATTISCNDPVGLTGAQPSPNRTYAGENEGLNSEATPQNPEEAILKQAPSSHKHSDNPSDIIEVAEIGTIDDVARIGDDRAEDLATTHGEDPISIVEAKTQNEDPISMVEAKTQNGDHISMVEAKRQNGDHIGKVEVPKDQPVDDIIEVAETTSAPLPPDEMPSKTTSPDPLGSDTLEDEAGEGDSTDQSDNVSKGGADDSQVTAETQEPEMPHDSQECSNSELDLQTSTYTLVWESNLKERGNVCSFGDSDKGNMNKKNKYITARIEEARVLEGLVNRRIHSMKAKAENGEFKYDDLLILTLNDHIIMASDERVVKYNSGKDIGDLPSIVKYDWNKTIGGGMGNDDIHPAWCSGEYLDCLVPETQVKDAIKIEMDNFHKLDRLAYPSAPEERIFKLITTGDDDKGQDCRHGKLILKIEVVHGNSRCKNPELPLD